MIGANFEAILKAVPPELMAQVAELYKQEAAEDALACEQERAEIGRVNREFAPPVRDGFGAMSLRVHSTDYWAQQVIHRAPNDPDLWKWFIKTPEGEYARVNRPAPARIVVPGWRDGLWSTVKANLQP